MRQLSALWQSSCCSWPEKQGSSHLKKGMNTADTSMGHRTVFLVDDDSSTANLYSTKLEQAGFRTELAFDKQAACDALPNLSADLIILNLMLPKRGGFELL